MNATTTVFSKQALYALLWIVTGALAASAATVTIDPSREEQTIQGIGGVQEYDDISQVNDMVRTMGFSMLRLHTGPDNFHGGRSACIAWMRAAQDAANLRGEGDTVRFIGGAWSPPAEYKTNHSDIAGNLDPAYYDAYADYLIQFYKDIESGSGCRLYAVNFSNEPSFDNPFHSCVYTPFQWGAFLKVFGPKLNRELPHVRTLGTCDVMEICNFTIESAVARDTVTRRLLTAMGVHHYVEDAPGPDTNVADVRLWKTARTFASQRFNNIPLLMTETSGDSPQWSGSTGGFGYAYGIFNALYYGKAVAWTHYGAPWTTYVYPRRAYMQYARFIRPGAIAVATTADDLNVRAIAFKHPRLATLTVVLLNVGSSSVSVSISMPGLPSTFQSYRSSATEACVSLGSVAPSAITLPAQTITTLVGSYTVSTRRPDASARRPAAVRSQIGERALYRLDGTRIGSGAGHAGMGVSVAVRTGDGQPGLVLDRGMVAGR